jgi:hypothetical protein
MVSEMLPLLTLDRMNMLDCYHGNQQGQLLNFTSCDKFYLILYFYDKSLSFNAASSEFYRMNLSHYVLKHRYSFYCYLYCYLLFFLNYVMWVSELKFIFSLIREKEIIIDGGHLITFKEIIIDGNHKIRKS